VPEYILIQPTAGSSWVRARETDLPDEATLQTLVKQHPETLPLDDIGGVDAPILIVGLESPLGNGFVDVVGVDGDGLVTVIECKLDRNPEVKRKVIGQILGYGAYMWGLTYEAFEQQIVRPYFDNPKVCHLGSGLVGVGLDDAMEQFRLKS
jgi:hypothetical protein